MRTNDSEQNIWLTWCHEALLTVVCMPQVNSACQQAMRCWWEDGHPGWMIFTLGNQHFERLDDIIAVRTSARDQDQGGRVLSILWVQQFRWPAGVKHLNDVAPRIMPCS